MNSNDYQQIIALNAQQRCEYLLKQLAEQQQVWTIVDDDGVMLLVSEDEDCMPIWPAEEFVQEWINGDWAHCRPQAISLQDWQSKWLSGLEDDEVEIVLFPLPGDGGIVISPWEMADQQS